MSENFENIEEIEYDDLIIPTNEFGEVVKTSYSSEVLQLTPFDDGNQSVQSYGVIAEYNEIDTKAISVQQKQLARSFVNKIEKFVLDFNDTNLTEVHKEYIRQVGELELQNMADLMSLVTINKQMIDNVVARINASQAEDYTIINAYNNLINQHLKLSKELATAYKAIPSVIKKMKADVLNDEESSDVSQTVITEAYGETQFNNGKEMLKKLLESRNKK